jgi:phosphoribosylformylglycinamidine synthase
MTAIGGRFGLTIELGKAPVFADESIRDDQVLFSESCGRFLATVPKGRAREFERIFDGLPCGLAGEVTENPELVIIGKSGKEILRENIFSLRKSWAGN